MSNTCEAIRSCILSEEDHSSIAAACLVKVDFRQKNLENQKIANEAPKPASNAWKNGPPNSNSAKPPTSDSFINYLLENCADVDFVSGELTSHLIEATNAAIPVKTTLGRPMPPNIIINIRLKSKVRRIMQKNFQRHYEDST